MSRPVCLLLLAVLSAAAFAAPPQQRMDLTVGELDHLLAGMRDMSDRKAATELAGLKLTERASSEQLQRWNAAFPGSRTREALLALVDASAFLRPPAADIPAVPAPDEKTKKEMISSMIGYVTNTLRKLPNFVADRTTTAYQITMEQYLLPQLSMTQMLQPGAKQPSYHGYHALGPSQTTGLLAGKLFWIGSFTQSVTYHDGTEIADSSAATLIKTGHLAIGLISSGEFGSILQVALMDVNPEEIAWDRWERGAAGNLAVFHFAVPRGKSHIAVTTDADGVPDFPAYKGEIVMDPSSGTIYRIAIFTNSHDPSTSLSNTLIVEFGPTQIGGVTYMCPVHGVAITKVLSPYADLDADPPPAATRTSINDISFTNFHVFRSDSRVLPATPNP